MLWFSLIGTMLVLIVGNSKAYRFVGILVKYHNGYEKLHIVEGGFDMVNLTWKFLLSISNQVVIDNCSSKLNFISLIAYYHSYSVSLFIIFNEIYLTNIEHNAIVLLSFHGNQNYIDGFCAI